MIMGTFYFMKVIAFKAGVLFTVREVMGNMKLFEATLPQLIPTTLTEINASTS